MERKAVRRDSIPLEFNSNLDRECISFSYSTTGDFFLTLTACLPTANTSPLIIIYSFVSYSLRGTRVGDCCGDCCCSNMCRASIDFDDWVCARVPRSRIYLFRLKKISEKKTRVNNPRESLHILESIWTFRKTTFRVASRLTCKWFSLLA